MRTSWTDWINGIETAARSLALDPDKAWQTDYAALSTAELLALRGTMRGAPAAERDRFHAELRKRIQRLREKTRRTYRVPPHTELAHPVGSRAALAAESAPGHGFAEGVRPRPVAGKGSARGALGGPDR